MLDSLVAGLARPNAHYVLHVLNENFAVADLASVSRFLNGLDNIIGHISFGEYFYFDLGDEIDHVFGAAIILGMTFLAAKTFDLGNGESADIDLAQSFADVVESEGFNNCCYQFHIHLTWVGRKAHYTHA